MSKRHQSRRPRAALVAVAALAVIGAAACGGSSAAKTAATTTSTTAAGGRAGFAAAFTAYRQCLSQHGVNLPQRTPGTGSRPPTSGTGDGGPGGGGFGGGGFGGTPQSLPKGVTQSQFTAAQQACRSKLPTGGFGGARGGAAFQAYASCMRDHGITIGARPAGGATTTTVAGASGSSTTTGTGTPGFGFGRQGFNRSDPKFIAANKVCAALLPSRTATTTTTAG